MEKFRFKNLHALLPVLVVALFQFIFLIKFVHYQDIDEAKILKAGIDFLKQGQYFYFYTPIGHKWEMIPSYLYGIFSLLSGFPRLLSWL